MFYVVYLSTDISNKQRCKCFLYVCCSHNIYSRTISYTHKMYIPCKELTGYFSNFQHIYGIIVNTLASETYTTQICSFYKTIVSIRLLVVTVEVRIQKCEMKYLRIVKACTRSICLVKQRYKQTKKYKDKKQRYKK